MHVSPPTFSKQPCPVHVPLMNGMNKPPGAARAPVQEHFDTIRVQKWPFLEIFGRQFLGVEDELGGGTKRKRCPNFAEKKMLDPFGSSSVRKGCGTREHGAT